LDPGNLIGGAKIGSVSKVMWTFHYWAETYEMDLSTFFPDTLDWSVRRVRVVVLILNLKTHLSK